MSIRTVLVERIHYGSATVCIVAGKWEHLFEVSREYFTFWYYPLLSKFAISGAYSYQPRLRRVISTTGVNFV